MTEQQLGVIKFINDMKPANIKAPATTKNSISLEQVISKEAFDVTISMDP